MPANYDNAAWFYDRLSRLIYGSNLLKAQRFLLKYIPNSSRILIAGGGTGSILDEITCLYPSGLHITYVETSAKMIALSRKRNLGLNKIEFIAIPAENFIAQQPFDVVITPFLFDNFTEAGFQQLFIHLQGQLKSGGLWLNADFQLTGKWWQSVLLGIMYRFFHLLDCVNVSRLPAIDAQFFNNHYSILDQKTFSREFVKSTVYCKP